MGVFTGDVWLSFAKRDLGIASLSDDFVKLELRSVTQLGLVQGVYSL